MATAQVTVKLETSELAVIQEALKVYLMGLRGDDTATRFRRFNANSILSAIGMGMPAENGNGRQLSFVAESPEEELEETPEGEEVQETEPETESAEDIEPELEPVAA